MPELPESVPKGQLAAAIALVLLGFIVILFAGGRPIIWLGALLVLAGGGIGTKLGLDLWKATE